MAMAIAYRRHFLLLSVAVVLLHLSGRALDQIPVGNIRDLAIFGLPGALHAGSVLLSLRRRPNIARSVFFVALAACFNFGAIFSGLIALPLFPFVPVIVRLVPQLRDIGDSTPGDSVRVLFYVIAASACGSLAYWFVVRAFWMKSLRYRDLFRTVTLCVTATILAFIGLAILGSSPAYFNSTRSVRDILPTVMWWFAFSASLWWSESRGDQGEVAVVQPIESIQ
jgi:hypothetical protein